MRREYQRINRLEAEECHGSRSTSLVACSSFRKSTSFRMPALFKNRLLSTARSWSTIATEFFPALGSATMTGGAASGEELRGTTTGVARHWFISFEERITQGRLFLISPPTVGPSLTHQISPRSIFIIVKRFPIPHLAVNPMQFVCLPSGYFESVRFPFQFPRNQICDKLRTLASRYMCPQSLHEGRGQFKSDLHMEYTIHHTIKPEQEISICNNYS